MDIAQPNTPAVSPAVAAVAESERHPFQQVLQLLRTQPDLHYILEAKRAAECGAPRFDMRSMIPDRGIVTICGACDDSKFVSHLLEAKPRHLAFAVCGNSQQRLLPEVWCKLETFESMLHMRGGRVGQQAPPLVVILDYEMIDRRLKQKLFFNSRGLNLLVVALVSSLARLPLAFRANVDIAVELGVQNGLTRIEQYASGANPRAKLYHYISPYTIALDRYRRDQATQVQIYKSARVYSIVNS